MANKLTDSGQGNHEKVPQEPLYRFGRSVHPVEGAELDKKNLEFQELEGSISVGDSDISQIIDVAIAHQDWHEYDNKSDRPFIVGRGEEGGLPYFEVAFVGNDLFVYECIVALIDEGWFVFPNRRELARIRRLEQQTNGQSSAEPTAILRDDQIDVYLSYSRLDEQSASGDSDDGWVSRFTKTLELSISQHLGREVSFWRDTDIQPNQKFAEQISDSLRHAKLLLVILSPAYVKSEFCLREFGEFVKFSSENLKSALPRIFPVLIRPVQPDFMPKELQRIQYADFRDVNSGDLDQPEFIRKIDELAKGMANTLINLETDLPFDAADRRSTTNRPQSEVDESEERKAIWLCQYRRSEMRTLEERMVPGLVERWRIQPYSPSEINEQIKNGDAVALWRTIDEVKHLDNPKSRGGVVGWGQVLRQPDDLANGQISIRLVDAFPDKPIQRDEILKLLGRGGSNWPGQVSLKLLESDEVEVFRRFIPNEGLQPQSREHHETELVSDRAETTRDLLGRAPLAFTLSHHINRIWTEQTKLREIGKRSPTRDEAAFILHIDAPWGGGKTTFANFISRILNPKNYELDTSNTADDENSLFADLRLDDENYWPRAYTDRKWITITFNAWQNQHVTPPWWNFSEAIRNQCLRALPFYERWINSVCEWSWRVWSPATRRAVLTTFFLGIAAFVIYWTGFYAWLEKTDFAGVKLSMIGTAIASGGIGVLLFGSIRSGLSTLISSVTESIDIQKLGESDPLERFRLHFAKTVNRIGRPILVVVDDLDRCDPKYVVELVRGMLTIFRSPRVVFILLGDKGWIETSFAKVHEEMEIIHEDDNSTFGGRFAEKAIQLSFILPEPHKSDRETYIDYLLLGRSPTQSLSVAESTVDVKQFEEEAKSRFRDAKSSRERNEVLAETRNIASSQFSSSPVALRATAQIINREATMRAASSERTEREIRHGLSALKAELPDNPRRIKRIINMIAIYQASAQSVFSVDPGTDAWRQLVLWVILMSEHPEGWRILCTRPDLADKVSNGKALQEKRKQKTNTDENPDIILLARLSQAKVVRLITGQSFENENVTLDTKAVSWLRRLTPIA